MRLKKAQSTLPDHKLNPLHFLAGVTIQRGEIPWRQALHLTFPSGIRNLDAQHRIRELQSSRPLGDDRSANQGPGQQWGFALRHASQRLQNNFPQSRSRLLHCNSS